MPALRPWISILGAAAVGVLLFSFAGPVVHLFNAQADPEVLRIGEFCIRAQSLTLPIHALASTINMFFADIGRTHEALWMSTAWQGCCLIPMLLTLPALLGSTGLAISQAAADLLSLLIAIPMSRRAHRLTTGIAATLQ